MKIKLHLSLKEEQKSIANCLAKKCTSIDNAIEQKNWIEKLTGFKNSLIYGYATGKKEV